MCECFVKCTLVMMPLPFKNNIYCYWRIQCISKRVSRSPNQCLSLIKLWVQIPLKARSRLGFLNQYNWPPRYIQYIIESGVKHHNTNHWRNYNPYALHSRLILWFVTRVARRVPLVDQEMPTLPEHMSPTTCILCGSCCSVFIFLCSNL